MKKIFFYIFLFFISFKVLAFEEISMVKVEGGTFVMGGGENKEHEIYVSDFMISIYEITIGQWTEYCDDTGYDFDFQNRVLVNYFLPSYEYDASLPIFSITWSEAITFCNWLSEKFNYLPCYEIIEVDKRNKILNVKWNKDANGFRLPTEAEWEYASRGGKLENEKSCEEPELSNRAWYLDNSNFLPHNVGLLTPNCLGIYDMLGNVSEWCYDFFDITYYEKSEFNNPSGPDVGYAPNYYNFESWEPIGKVVRGGNFESIKKWSNEYYRSGAHFYHKSRIGIRVVRNSCFDNIPAE